MNVSSSNAKDASITVGNSVIVVKELNEKSFGIEIRCRTAGTSALMLGVFGEMDHQKSTTLEIIPYEPIPGSKFDTRPVKPPIVNKVPSPPI